MDAKAQLAKSLKKIYPHISPAACANLAGQLDGIIVRTIRQSKNPEVIKLWRHMSADDTPFLAKLREEAGLTRQQACDEFGWSLSKLSRLENGSMPLRKDSVKLMIAVYGVTDPAIVQELIGRIEAKLPRTNPA